MPKFYVQSGPVRLVLDAINSRQAAVQAFQWSCDRQSTIQTESPLEHVQLAEQRGWQLHESIDVSETGFDRPDAYTFDTLEIVAVWQAAAIPCVSAQGQ